MATIAESLETAAQHHRAGNLQHAEQVYRQVLEEYPRHPVALYLLGTVFRNTNRHDLAIDYIRQALRIKPDYIEAHNNLGNALAGQGLLGEAAECYQAALRLKPDYSEAHSNLGNVLVDLGKLDEAVYSYQWAVRLNPQFANAQYNLGLVFKKLGKLNEALSCFRQAMRLFPPARKMHDDLRKALAARGKLDEAVANSDEALWVGPDHATGYLKVGDFLLSQGRLDEAAACYRLALRLQPNFSPAVNSLGIALYRQRKLEEAVDCYRQALQLQPDHAEALHSLGLALASQGKLAEAVDCYRQALELQPGYVEARNALGVALDQQGKLDEALACYEEALHLQPDTASAHTNRALLWLLSGNFEQGWPEYEWRWLIPDGPRRPRHPALWDGSPLAGRTILLFPEQGLGDTLQFVRYAPLLHQQGGRVVVECQKPLARILTSCPGIAQLVSRGSELPDADVQAPLLSLPGILGTSLATIPANVPYISTDAELVEHWRRELSGITEFKIGIAWQGNPGHPLDRYRSFPLEYFAPVARLSRVRLFSLQKGFGTEQITRVEDRFPVTDLASRLDDFMDTAAVMENLDLIITVDSAVAHLAGALGVPVWVALSLVPDWRWLLHRDDSPWYPTMRLFRQVKLGDWQAVFDRLRVGVQQLIAAEPGAGRSR
jgi:tetratricopeptide (TPR) repeat protein